MVSLEVQEDSGLGRLPNRLTSRHVGKCDPGLIPLQTHDKLSTTMMNFEDVEDRDGTRTASFGEELPR